MKWIIHKEINRADCAVGLAWAKAFIAQYDTSRLEAVRIDKGRGKFHGAYGRCQRGVRKEFLISCQIPGPWPYGFRLRLRPTYLDELPADNPRTVESVSALLGPRMQLGEWVTDTNTGRSWVRVNGLREVQNADEALVWLFAHEAFHFLRKTKQIPGINNEIQADAFAEARFLEWKDQP